MLKHSVKIIKYFKHLILYITLSHSKTTLHSFLLSDHSAFNVLHGNLNSSLTNEDWFDSGSVFAKRRIRTPNTEKQDDSQGQLIFYVCVCVCVRAQVAVDMQAVSLCDIKAEIRVDGAAAWETGY